MTMSIKKGYTDMIDDGRKGCPHRYQYNETNNIFECKWCNFKFIYYEKND